jgi:hypothetical protein
MRVCSLATLEQLSLMPSNYFEAKGSEADDTGKRSLSGFLTNFTVPSTDEPYRREKRGGSAYSNDPSTAIISSWECSEVRTEIPGGFCQGRRAGGAKASDLAEPKGS